MIKNGIQRAFIYRTEDLIKKTQNKSKKTVGRNVIEKQEEEEQDEEIER